MRDYLHAHSIDPNLQADLKADRIVNFVIQAYNLIHAKGKLKSKRLAEIVNNPQGIDPKQSGQSLPASVKFPTNEE